MDFQYELFNAIDSIDNITIESEIIVLNSLMNTYDKAMVIQEYYEGDNIESFDIFQEGESIMDQATGKNTGDSTFEKIVKFLPRLVIAIGKAIKNAFTKDFSANVMNDAERASFVLNNASPEELQRLQAGINGQFNGYVTFDPNTKKLTFKEKCGRMLNKVVLVTSLIKIIGRVKQEMTMQNTPYKALANEIKSILAGDKKFDEESSGITVNALGQVLKDLPNASFLLKSTLEEIVNGLEKKIAKDYANGKNPQKLAEANELVTQLRDVMNTVAWTSFGAKVGAKVLSFIGRGRITGESGGQNLINDIAGNAMHSEEIAERNEARNEAQELKARAAGEKARYKKEQKIANQTARAKDKIDKYQKKLDKYKDKKGKETGWHKFTRAPISRLTRSKITTSGLSDDEDEEGVDY